MATQATPFDAFANILTPEVLNALRAQKRGQLAALDAQLSGRAKGDRASGRLVGGLIDRFIGPGRKQAKEARVNQSTLSAAQEAVADREENQGVEFSDTLSRQEAVVNEAIKIARDSGNFDLANDLLTSATAIDERRANLNLLKSQTTLNIAKARESLGPDNATSIQQQKLQNTLVTAAAKGEQELRTAIDTQTSDVQKSLSSVGTVNSILESAGEDYLTKSGGGPDASFAVSDAAMIRAFMLMLEPNSVVRESEFQTMSDARAAIENGSISDETARRVQQFTSGEFLRPGQRRQMVGLIRAEQGRLEDRVSQIVSDTDRIIKVRNERITESGLPASRLLDRDAVLGDFLTDIVKTVAPVEAEVEEEDDGVEAPATSGGPQRVRVKVN